MPALAVREAKSALSSSSGIGSPVSWCLLIRASASGFQHQFSSICEGASTKSRSTRVPANISSSTVEQSWCITCPNSWKNVSTSRWVSKAGDSAVGLGKLHTMAATGGMRRPPSTQPGCSPKHAAWPYLPARGCMSM
eukprot:1318580-Pleurochrysis_carterae.AAC.4